MFKETQISRETSLLGGRTRWFVSVPTLNWFWSLWGFIGTVSAYDAWLVVLTKSEIYLTEENPVCRFLIRLEPDNLSCFLPLKAAGTIVVLAVLYLLYARLRWHGLTAATGVAGFQLGLLVYLQF